MIGAALEAGRQAFSGEGFDSGEIADSAIESTAVGDIQAIADDIEKEKTGTLPRKQVLAAAMSPIPGARAGKAIAKNSDKAANILSNAATGRARHAAGRAKLEAANPGKSIQNEQYLRDANGKIARDPQTGMARRVDEVVFDDETGTAKAFEITGSDVNKASKMARQDRRNGEITPPLRWMRKVEYRLMVSDFRYLNAAQLLARYKANESRWRESMADMLSEEIAFFKRNNLLREGAQALAVDFSEAQIMFSDFTDLGQDFLMSQQVEKWREAYSRRNTKNPSAKPVGADLDRRLKKFLEQRKATSH